MTQNLKALLAQQARLQAEKSALIAEALKAIETQTGLIDADLTTVTGLVASIVDEGAAAMRAAQAKDTGAVNFVRDGIKVTHTVSKVVTWDQAKLSAVAARIAGAGDDPTAYMATEYKVSEKNYKEWPDAVKHVFNDARTVKPGKPKVTFKEV